MEHKMNAWNGEGLPPVGAEIETRIDFDKAPPYVLANLSELGVDIRKHVPKFQKGIVAYCSKKYLVIFSPNECLVPMACVEIRPIKTHEQIQAEIKKEKVEEMIQQLRKTNGCGWYSIAEDLYDAGYRKV